MKGAQETVLPLLPDYTHMCTIHITHCIAQVQSTPSGPMSTLIVAGSNYPHFLHALPIQWCVPLPITSPKGLAYNISTQSCTYLNLALPNIYWLDSSACHVTNRNVPVFTRNSNYVWVAHCYVVVGLSLPWLEKLSRTYVNEMSVYVQYKLVCHLTCVTPCVTHSVTHCVTLSHIV